MTTENTYQGWTNYATWVVKVWMENEEPSYRYWRETTAFILDHPHYQNEYMAEDRRIVHELAERLKADHEDVLPELTGFAADLLNASFGAVNWTEIAERLIQDAHVHVET